jgi:hypothetical protein
MVLAVDAQGDRPEITGPAPHQAACTADACEFGCRNKKAARGARWRAYPFSQRLATQYPPRKKGPHTETPSIGVRGGDFARDAKYDQTARVANSKRRTPGGKISAGMFIFDVAQSISLN